MKKIILSTILVTCISGLFAKGLSKHQFHRTGRYLYTRFSQDAEAKIQKIDKQKTQRISLPILDLDYTYDLGSSKKLEKMTAEGMVTYPIHQKIFLGAGARVKLPLEKYKVILLPRMPNFSGDFVLGRKIDSSSLVRVGVSYDPHDKERISMGYLTYEVRY